MSERTHSQPTYQDLEMERQKAKDRLQNVIGDIQKLKEKAKAEGQQDLVKALDYIINIQL